MKSLIGYSKWITLITLTSILVLSGCSASWHLNQAIKKDPSLKQATTQLWDTTIVTKERSVSDTILVTRDTTIVRDSVVIKYRLLANGKAQIDVICPPEQIKIQKEYVTQVIKAPYSNRWAMALMFLTLGITLLLTLNRLFKW